jgi:hypothetical protein
MVYKTKKSNKRKRKISQKISGGSVIPTASVPPPTVISNIANIGKIALSAGTNFIGDKINKVAQSLNVDLNQPLSESISGLSNKVGNIVNVLKGETGQQLMANASELGKDVVDIAAPAAQEALSDANQLISKETSVIGDMANKAFLEIPVVGQAAAVAEAGLDVIQAGETAVESAANLTSTGSKLIEDIKEEKNKLDNLVNQGKELFGQEINNVVEQNMPDYSSNIQKGGSLKKIHKQGVIIGGRAHQSYLDFLAPHVKRSRIIKRHMSRWRTRKYSKT